MSEMKNNNVSNKNVYSQVINELIIYIEENDLGEARCDYSFSMLTTLKVGGDIALTYFPNSYLSFLNFYFFFIENYSLPIFMIGNGSNILASDDFYNGIVICFKKIENEIELNCYDDYCEVTAAGGCMSKKLADFLSLHELSGAEPIASIPATIGGILSMNATCFGYESCNYIKKCLVLDQDKIYWITKDEMEFSYRNSVFLKKRLIILKAVFVFKKGSKEEIYQRGREVIERRKKTQPIYAKSAGSTFKNGDGYSAWQVIDEAGLRGYTLNGAKVSDLHANFIINDNNATAKDIYDLMEYVKKVVKEKYNVELESEWVLINF